MKTNIGLIEYCKAQLGKPYWFGCYGQLSTLKLYEAKKKQYPKYYTATNYSKQLGVKVHDCAGLIKGYLWCDSPSDTTPTYNSKTDYGATAFYSHCKKKGKWSKSVVMQKGTLVFKGNDKTKTHVGVYIGDDYVIEAKGHAYGVVKTKLSTGKWTHYGELELIGYMIDEPIKNTEPTNSELKPVEMVTKTELITADSKLPKVYKVTATHGLNLRRAPNSADPKNLICCMPKGSKFEVSKISGNWAYGKYKTRVGYANIKYLE